ncbi:MAG: magnesium transporter [Rhodospirillaceae bacterium]|nr:magnesium transporter [Rhodospirillaceae bacterium]
MTEETVIGVNNSGAAHELTPEFIAAVNLALDQNETTEAISLAQSLHYADLADLLENLAHVRRAELVEALRSDFDPNVFAELDDTVRERVIDQLGISHIAEAVAGLDTDDALDVVEELNADEQQEVLEALPAGERSLIEQGLSYPEDSAGRLMQREVVAVPMHWTVGQAIDYMRDTENLPTDFFDLFLVDPLHNPVGTVPLSRVMRTGRDVELTDVMRKHIKIVPVEMDQEEVAFLFRQRDLISAPVVDGAGRLVGVITVDDIVDVIYEEHEEDIMRLAGVGEEDDLYSAVIDTMKSRFSWLLIHLGAAMIAAYVISFFAGTIEEMVALAVLMPIVATMGGTASVQTLTVAVRAIAMKELTMSNAYRTIGKEVAVGVLNGILFAILIGAVAWAWFGSPALGGVIGLAIVINLIVAGFTGSALPILLQRMGYDPAVASSAFLTSITDVVGFYVFLGLAASLLL